MKPTFLQTNEVYPRFIPVIKTLAERISPAPAICAPEQGSPKKRIPPAMMVTGASNSFQLFAARRLQKSRLGLFHRFVQLFL